MRRVAGSENSAIVAVLAAVLLFSLIELIIKRLVADRRPKPRMFVLPAFLLCLSAIAYLQFV